MVGIAYDLHELFVSMSDTDNKLSRRVNRLLQRKYLPRLVDLPILPEEDFLKAWRKCFDEGSLDLAIYAAASRKDLSLDSKAELFGTIHMSMHETSGTVAKLKKELIRAGEAARAAEGKNRGLTLAYRELKKEAGELKEALEKQRLKTAHARMKSEAASPELASPAPGTPAGDQDNGPGQDGEREADERLEICRLKRELINLRKRPGAWKIVLSGRNSSTWPPYSNYRPFTKEPRRSNTVTPPALRTICVKSAF